MVATTIDFPPNCETGSLNGRGQAAVMKPTSFETRLSNSSG
jgi:hypothetical protein